MIQISVDQAIAGVFLSAFFFYFIGAYFFEQGKKLSVRDEAEMERQKTFEIAKRLRKLVKTIYPKSVPWRLVMKGNQASDCIEVIDALIEQTKEQDEVAA